VFGAMRDKELDGMLTVLLPAFGRIIVTRPSNPRAADPADLAARVRTLAPTLPVDIVASPRAALAAATTTLPLVVVAGSIFLLGDIIPEIDA
jgi:folylpolyglutamate synthase/dihydropteroate synthase